MKTKTKPNKKTEVEQTTETVPTQPTAIPPKLNWGNPFHNQQRFNNKIIGGKRGFSGASRKGMGGK